MHLTQGPSGSHETSGQLPLRGGALGLARDPFWRKTNPFCHTKVGTLRDSCPSDPSCGPHVSPGSTGTVEGHSHVCPSSPCIRRPDRCTSQSRRAESCART